MSKFYAATYILERKKNFHLENSTIRQTSLFEFVWVWINLASYLATVNYNGVQRHRVLFSIIAAMSAIRRNHQFGPNNPSFRYISYYSSCTTDERIKDSNNLEKYHRYAFWIFRIISPPQCPLSVETTNFAPTTLNFDISNYVSTKDERSKKSNYLGTYRRYEFWIFWIISAPKYPLSAETTNLL